MHCQGCFPPSCELILQQGLDSLPQLLKGGHR
jgi:hypothetical protein